MAYIQEFEDGSWGVVTDSADYSECESAEDFYAVDISE
jgi:hypothetical protein